MLAFGAIAAIKLRCAGNAPVQRATAFQGVGIRCAAIDLLVLASIHANDNFVAAGFGAAPQTGIGHSIDRMALRNPVCHPLVQIRGVALRHGDCRHQGKESENYPEHFPVSQGLNWQASPPQLSATEPLPLDSSAVPV